MVKWLHAPGHSGSVGPRVIRFATRRNPLIIDWSEMYRNINDLFVNAKDYDHFVGPRKRRDKRGRIVNHDVVISTRIDAKIVHDEEFFVSKEISRNLKYMPERWGKARVIDAPDGSRILIIAWHPQPRPLQRRLNVLASYTRGVRRVQRVQRRLEREYEPDLVLNGGDLQLLDGRTWVHPNKLAERLGMKYRRYHIDWQMWKGPYRVVRFKKLNPSKINRGMDHMWTLLALRKET